MISMCCVTYASLDHQHSCEWNKRLFSPSMCEKWSGNKTSLLRHVPHLSCRMKRSSCWLTWMIRLWTYHLVGQVRADALRVQLNWRTQANDLTLHYLAESHLKWGLNFMSRHWIWPPDWSIHTQIWKFSLRVLVAKFGAILMSWLCCLGDKSWVILYYD